MPASIPTLLECLPHSLVADVSVDHIASLRSLASSPFSACVQSLCHSAAPYRGFPGGRRVDIGENACVLRALCELRSLEYLHVGRVVDGPCLEDFIKQRGKGLVVFKCESETLGTTKAFAALGCPLRLEKLGRVACHDFLEGLSSPGPVFPNLRRLRAPGLLYRWTSQKAAELLASQCPNLVAVSSSLLSACGNTLRIRKVYDDLTPVELVSDAIPDSILGNPICSALVSLRCTGPMADIHNDLQLLCDFLDRASNLAVAELKTDLISSELQKVLPHMAHVPSVVLGVVTLDEALTLPDVCAWLDSHDNWRIE
eukprot:m51a1_g4407 hypothetical protein (313) ;mRNA; f:429649-431034